MRSKNNSRSKPLKIIVIGATGMLGTDLVQSLKNTSSILAPTRHECDLTKLDSVKDFFEKNTADYVINCSSFTQVDRCEIEPEKAYEINAAGTNRLVQACKKIPLIHISTDYVFDGEQKIYTTTDEPNPQTVYGKSKLFGETYAQELKEHFIIRTAWLYGRYGRNFVKTVLSLAKQDGPLRIVNDQIGCPTYTKDLAKAITSLIGTSNYGIHHAVGTGSCSWYDLAELILKTMYIDKEIIPISTEESFKLFPNIKAKRPKNSVLKNTLPMRPWDEALEHFLLC